MKGYVSVALVLMTSMSPTQNHVTPRFSMLTAGDEFTCGLTTDGAAWCWGANQNGQLGSRSTETCKGVMYVARGACSLRPARVSCGLRFRVIVGRSNTGCGFTQQA